MLRSFSYDPRCSVSARRWITAFSLLVLLPVVAVSCGDTTTEAVAVASIEISPTSAELEVGEEQQFSATPQASDGTSLPDRSISWSAGDPSIVDVSSDGIATGLAPGATVVRATAGGATGSAEVNVEAVPIATVSISPDSVRIEIGKEVQLEATPRDEDGNDLTNREVSWMSSEPSVASVDQNGRVTGQAVGGATITATSEGVSGDGKVNVVPIPVESVEISPDSAIISVEEELTLTATMRDRDGNELSDRDVTWSSSNPSIASVSQEGVVTGVGIGTTTISAVSEGKEGQAEIRVAPSTGILLTLVSEEPTNEFAVGIDGGSFGSEPRVVSVSASDTTSATAAFSLPAGGPYRVRGIATGGEARSNQIAAESGYESGISISEGELAKVTVTLEGYSVST